MTILTELLQQMPTLFHIFPETDMKNEVVDYPHPINPVVKVIMDTPLSVLNKLDGRQRKFGSKLKFILGTFSIMLITNSLKIPTSLPEAILRVTSSSEFLEEITDGDFIITYSSSNILKDDDDVFFLLL